jgi:hypothetical protein
MKRPALGIGILTLTLLLAACGTSAPTEVAVGATETAMLSCSELRLDTIAFACGPQSSHFEPACTQPLVPGETTLDQATEPLRACSLVDDLRIEPEPQEGAGLFWRCAHWQSSGDALLASGERSRAVAQGGVVQRLLWRLGSSADCTPTASAIVERYGVPEKVLWAVAGYTNEIKWGEIVMLYPSQGLVFEVGTTQHFRSVQRGDSVLAVYRFAPTTLDALAGQPAQYDWQFWPSEHEGGVDRIPWTEKLENWPGFSP